MVKMVNSTVLFYHNLKKKNKQNTEKLSAELELPEFIWPLA